MKRKYFWTMIGVLLLGFLQMQKAEPTYACWCIGPGTVQQELARHTAVFTGKVVGTIEDPYVWPEAEPYILRSAIFEVDTAWKGVSSRYVVIGDGPSMCNAHFEVGESYIVYAYPNEWNDKIYSSPTTTYGKRLYASGPCSRNGRVSDAATDIRELGPGKTVPGQAGPSEILSILHKLFLAMLHLIAGLIR